MARMAKTPAPLTPEERADRAKQRALRDIERVRLKRLAATVPDERLNTSDHALSRFMKMHESRLVDESGAPALREVLVRHLSGEKSQRSKLVALLHQLNREHKKLYAVVNVLISAVEQGDMAPSIRVMAVQLKRTKSSVHRSLVALRAWLTQHGIT